MNNNNIINYIATRLSLRAPQRKSLEILDQVLPDDVQDLTLEHVASGYPLVTDFHYDFPSLCFALATGVGKTRLMGAMIAYLYKTRGIRHFFVVVPNLTIYDKLKRDFTYGSPKYVFPGIGDFDGSNPIVIDGDNYTQIGSLLDSTEGKVIINIFNISKFNSTKETNKMKSLSEYLGQSYFSYLQSLDNMVMLMDESHRYKAPKSISALNQLQPILGLEFTATPLLNDGSKMKRAGNIIYEYSLAAALRDGFVKRPAIATRKNITDQMSQDQIDQMKITDGIYLHEETKLHLAAYAKNNDLPIVKPFMMINAADQAHADQLEAWIKSDEFFGGTYKHKALKIYSGLGGSDKDRAIKKLLEVENPVNPIEIVIQVAMLKEGRDVNNLYTIVPLKAFAAEILTEQTLGRGLRLPYGRLTGDTKVDQLTVVAHDRFQKLIDEANKPDSLIRNVIDLDAIPDLRYKRVLVETSGQFDDASLMMQKESIAKIVQENNIAGDEVKQAISTITSKYQDTVREFEKSNPSSGADPHHMQQATQKMLLEIEHTTEGKLLFGQFHSPEQARKFIETVAIDLSQQFIERQITIPKVDFSYPDSRIEFDTTYDLNTQLFLQLLVAEAPLIVRDLLSGEETALTDKRLKNTYNGTVEECLVSMILDISISELDYDIYHEWMFKLATQAVQAMKYRYPDEGDEFFKNIIQVYYKDIIFQEISRQIKSVKKYTTGEPVISIRSGSKVIRSVTKEVLAEGGIQHYRTYTQPASMITQFLFTGFQKSIQPYVSFDSNTERKFVSIIESSAETDIIKWLRPEADTFDIYYFDEAHTQHKYAPDFVVETTSTHFLVEIKASNMIEDTIVQQKKKAAEQRVAAVNTDGRYGTRKYVLLPDTLIKDSMTFAGIVSSVQ